MYDKNWINNTLTNIPKSVSHKKYMKNKNSDIDNIKTYIPNHLLKEATSDKPLNYAESQVKNRIEMLGVGEQETPINTKGIFKLGSTLNTKSNP